MVIICRFYRKPTIAHHDVLVKYTCVPVLSLYICRTLRTMKEGVYEELVHGISGDVRSDDKTLEMYSTDTSLFSVHPKVVVSPRTTQDVCALVSYASQHNMSLTGRSAGTGMDGGALTEGIVVDFGTYFKTIGTITVDSDNQVGHVSVQPESFIVILKKKR